MAPAVTSLAPVLLNIALRAHTAYMLAEVMRSPDDPRFARKAIPIRNLVIVGGLSLLVPALWLARGRPRYPFATDDLYLSIFWLDMVGNSLDLYRRYAHFDAIPHFHGTGALAAVLRRTWPMTRQRAFALATLVHGALELQELLTDIFFGTRNVHGAPDIAKDLGSGVLGAASYLAAPFASRSTWG